MERLKEENNLGYSFLYKLFYVKHKKGIAKHKI